MNARDLDPLVGLLRAGTLDAELAGLLAVLLAARTPLVAVSPDADLAGIVSGAMGALLPGDARLHEVAPDDDFAWLPEAPELGWRRERLQGAPPAHRLTPSTGVLLVTGLGAGTGIGGARARIVVRALAVGYGLIASAEGDGLDALLDSLAAPAVGTDADERSRLGLVLVVERGGRESARVTAAHYVRPVALDAHGHVQRLPPAVLATWSPGARRFDHFAWGVLPDLAGRLGVRPIDVEREQARRSAELRRLAAG